MTDNEKEEDNWVRQYIFWFKIFEYHREMESRNQEVFTIKNNN